MTKRIILAIAVGAVAATALEFINGMLTFLLPPLLVLTPLALIIAIAIALRLPDSDEPD